MNRTEKLRAIIEGYLNSPVVTFKPTHILSRDILQALKEAGLKFVETVSESKETFNVYHIEEIELEE